MRRQSRRLWAPLMILAAVALSLSPGLARVESAKADSQCASAVVVGLRGSGEAYDPATVGMGSTNYAAYQQIKRRIPDAKAWGLPYTAVAVNTTRRIILEYSDSIQNGMFFLRGYINQQIRDCPSQRIILVGYSQGAHVIADLLPLMGIDQNIRSHIGAVLLFGDPRFNPDSPVAIGTFNRKLTGIFSAQGIAPARVVSSTWFGSMRSYCSERDFICNWSTANFLKCPEGSACGHFGYVRDGIAATGGAWAGNLVRGMPVIPQAQPAPILPQAGGSGQQVSSGGITGHHVANVRRDGGTYLRVRNGPGYSSYAEVGRLYDGDGITIICQVLNGERVSNGRLFSYVWNKISWNGGMAYISDFYTDTPGVNQRLVGAPLC